MTHRPYRRPMQILLAEDNPGDVRLVREALGEGKDAPVLHVVRDGEEAWRFLRREGPFAEAPRPDLVLLDLNLPRRDGREVLADIKADPDLAVVPVVILTTSRYEDDVIRAYDLRANAYVVKPVSLESFLSVIRAIQHFWLQVVTLPLAPCAAPGEAAAAGDD